MVEVASAIAEGRNAIEQCASKLNGKGDLYLCFATPPLIDGFERGLESFDGPVYGCSGHGVIAEDREIEQRPAAVALSLRDVDLVLGVDTLKDHGATAAFSLARRWPRDGHTAIVLSDTAGFNDDIFFTELRRSLGHAPMVGGLATGAPSGRLFCGDHVASRRLTSLILRRPLQCDVIVTPSCDRLSEIATVAAVENNVIHTIGSEPAVEMLKRTVKASKHGSAAARTGNIFAGFLLDDKIPDPGPGDFLIRTLIGADQEAGTISVTGNAHVGQRFAFLYRDAEVARKDIEERLVAYTQTHDPNDILFGLYFNCAGRGQSLYQREGVDIALIRKHLGDFPLIGFLGNGEIASAGRRNVLHNFTGVLALVRKA